MTRACTEMSIAVVDSSAISMAGSHATAEAIMMTHMCVLVSAGPKVLCAVGLSYD